MRLFADSSVWFAATISPQGGSAEVFRRAMRGRHTVFCSLHVIKEVVRNLQKKGNAEAAQAFFDLYAAVRPDIIRPTRETLRRAKKVINNKDAPILASAEEAACDALVTLDRRHFFEPAVHRFAAPMRAVLPRDVLKEI